jgi:hypothetical protein
MPYSKTLITVSGLVAVALCYFALSSNQPRQGDIPSEPDLSTTNAPPLFSETADSLNSLTRTTEDSTPIEDGLPSIAILQTFKVIDADTGSAIVDAQIAYSDDVAKFNTLPTIEWTGWQRAKTSVDGIASFPASQQEQAYIAIVFADGYQPVRCEGFSGEHAPVYKLTLLPSYEISGRIIADAELDFKDCRVAITGTEGGAFDELSDTLRILGTEVAELDATGHFKFKDLPAGNFVIDAWGFYGQRLRKGNVSARISRLVVPSGSKGIELMYGEGLDDLPKVELELTDQLGNPIFPQELLIVMRSFPMIEDGKSPVIHYYNVVPIRTQDQFFSFGLKWKPRDATVMAPGYLFSKAVVSDLGEQSFLIQASAQVVKAVSLQILDSDRNPIRSLDFLLLATYHGASPKFIAGSATRFFSNSLGQCHLEGIPIGSYEVCSPDGERIGLDLVTVTESMSADQMIELQLP